MAPRTIATVQQGRSDKFRPLAAEPCRGVVQVSGAQIRGEASVCMHVKAMFRVWSPRVRSG